MSSSLSKSKLAEEFEQSVDTLLLDQDARQSHYAGDQSPGRQNIDVRICRGAVYRFHDFQPLTLVSLKMIM